MLRAGKMLMLAGVYDGQRLTLNIDVLMVDANYPPTTSFAVAGLGEFGGFDATAWDVILVNPIATFVAVTAVAVGNVARKP
ncbi:hypothetical protein PoB_000676900 [Plakobranchus ocellatus]|uniref:Uncharacterized protein n=1 Tax=Plakobranchus ocellatus TaxID=259542 RepID=A0AAV3YB69_9GAST|nr:hypothetical protein PoB_000676900 [Plakobranchus ocellatus]